mgnify:CR=1 FL=1
MLFFHVRKYPLNRYFLQGVNRFVLFRMPQMIRFL